MAEKGFDPAAEFLLGMNWANLFEPCGKMGWFRCKGCDAKVPGQEREKHFNKHKGIRQRMETMRQARIKRERQAQAARARAARERVSQRGV